MKAVRSWDIPRANAIQSASVPKRAKSHLDAKRIGKVTSGSKRLEYSYLDLLTELMCDLYLYPRNGTGSIPNMLTTVTTDVNTAIYVQAVMKWLVHSFFFQFSEKKSKNKVFSILVMEVLVICIIQAPSGCCTVNFKGKGVAHTGIGNFLGEGLDNYEIVKNVEM